MAEKAEPLKVLDEEQDILKHITMKTALKSVKELAKVRLGFGGGGGYLMAWWVRAVVASVLTCASLM
jgi:hypothetical protein